MEYLENSLILCGFDPYSPLYSLIIDYNFKLVSLEYVLTCLRVFSTSTWICLINLLLPLTRTHARGEEKEIGRGEWRREEIFSSPLCVGSDFPRLDMAGACGTSMVHIGEHPTCTSSLQLVVATMLANEAACHVQWHAMAHWSKLQSVQAADHLAHAIVTFD